jgi:ABC-type Fe3+/spermidine/putrescine transport system ATPase subunit
MDAVLELAHVSKAFATHKAVDDVSLSIPRGAFFSLLGPSGCGKTTTLRLVAGFESPTAGEIRLNGERIDSSPPYLRNVNTVFQSYALFPHLTVQGNVEFGLRNKSKDANPAADKVRRVLEQLGLSGKESRKPSQLSGGEKQRVALARALVLAPEVLLLDEPLSALDPQLRQQVRAELRDLQKKTGVTFLFVTHDQEEALSLSDALAVMRAGRVEQMGTPQELYRKPCTKFVAAFLGDINWIAGAGVRPESIHITRGAEPGGKKAVVSATSFLGPTAHVSTTMEDGTRVTVQVPSSDGPYAAQEAVYLSWSPADELRDLA